MRTTNIIALLALAACGSPEPFEIYDGPSEGRLVGVVTDEAGMPLSGVAVALSTGEQTQSGVDGVYRFEQLAPAPDLVATFSVDDRVKVYRKAQIVGWETVTLNAALPQVGAVYEFATVGGGTFDHGPLSLDIAPGALVDEFGRDYAGTAVLTLTAFDVSDDHGRIRGPGDYVGIDMSGNTVAIGSGGFFEASLETLAGDPLNLHPDRPARAEFDYPDKLPQNVEELAESTVPPLWWFDPDLATWVEEDSVTLEQSADGDKLVAEIPHFSWWNFDWVYEDMMTCVFGTVVDSFGNPIVGATVTLEGEFSRDDDPEGQWTTYVVVSTTTDENGEWLITQVPADTEMILTVEAVIDGETVIWQEDYLTGPSNSEWGDSNCEGAPPVEFPTCNLGAEYRMASTEVIGDLLIETSDPELKFNNLGVASAWFFDPENIESCEAPLAEVPIGSCVELPRDESFMDAIPDLSQTVTRGAGELVRFEDPAYAIDLEQSTESGQLYYVGYAAPTVPFVIDVAYDVLVQGESGGFPGYTELEAVSMPAQVEVTSPAQLSGLIVPRNADFVFEYVDTGSTEGVYVNINSEDDNWVCREADNGTITMPTEVLMNFAEGPVVVSLYRASITNHETPAGYSARAVGVSIAEVIMALE